MFRIFHLTLLAAILVLGGIGISRLSYNVEILDLLPEGLPGVEGTALFQKVYDRPDQLIVTLKSESDSVAENAADTLAEALRKAPGLAVKVRHRPSWEDNPSALLHLVAYAWLNAPPESLKKLQESLSASRVTGTLKTRMERLAGALDPMVVAMESNDPLGLTQALRSGVDSETMESFSGGGFANQDGTFRIIYMDAAKPIKGYREAGAWLDQTQAVVEKWRMTAADFATVKVAYTGRPAFEAEIGSGMEQDMSQSISGVTLIVGLLFWLLHRRIKPLLLIQAAVLGTSLITLGVAGIMFGSLNVMSMGFAAILMGMIDDFGVMGLHEAMHHPDASFQTIHRRVFPSIGWSAISSAVVFGALGLSTLPGVSQMGVLTGLGILIGAVVMLYGFLPLAMRWGNLCKKIQPVIVPSSKRARWPGLATLTIVLVCGSVLITRGLPGVATGAGVLRPKNCKAFEALMAFDSEMKPDKDRFIWLPVVVAQPNETALAASLEKTDALLVKAHGEGQTSGHFIPVAFAPDPARQRSNRAVLAALLAEQPRLYQAVEQSGFNDRALSMAKGVMELWATWIKEDATAVRWPDLNQLDDSLGRQLHRADGQLIACGFVRLPVGEKVFQTPLINQLQALPGVHVAGWDYLSSQLKSLMGREVRRVLLPAGAVLLILFFFVFRNWRERTVAVGSLAFSGLMLLAIMRLLGIEWNFVCIGAVPLCLGLGLDFNIHMIYSLRQEDETGDESHGIGRALAYCGLSTGLGFGPLGLSQNVGLSTFGLCTTTGVLSALFTAAFVVPWVWRKTRRTMASTGASGI